VFLRDSGRKGVLHSFEIHALFTSPPIRWATGKNYVFDLYVHPSVRMSVRLVDVLNVRKIIINVNKRVYYEKITNVSKR